LDQQAYQELIEAGDSIVVISGKDIAEMLIHSGCEDLQALFNQSEVIGC
jgi:hypothetical protein